jgi:hypothetical protein
VSVGMVEQEHDQHARLRDEKEVRWKGTTPLPTHSTDSARVEVGHI